jgi:GNAT superfamily N-acetyltransferase
MWSYFFGGGTGDAHAQSHEKVASDCLTADNLSADIKEAAALVALSMLNTPSYVEIFRGTEETRLEALTLLFERNFMLVASKCPSAVHICKSGGGGGGGGVECVFMLCRSGGVVAQTQSVGQKQTQGQGQTQTHTQPHTQGSAHFTLYEKVVQGGILEIAYRYGRRVLLRLIRVSDFFDAQDLLLMGGGAGGGTGAEGAATGEGVRTAAGTVAGKAAVAGTQTQTQTSSMCAFLSLQRMAVHPTLQGTGLGSRYLKEGLFYNCMIYVCICVLVIVV